MVDSCILKMPQYCKCCEYGLIYLLRSRSQTIQQASQRNYLYPSTQVSNARYSTDLWWPQLLNASMSSQNYTCSLLTCFILKVQSVIFDFFFPEKKDTVLINIDAVMSKYTFQQTNAFWKLIILKNYIRVSLRFVEVVTGPFFCPSPALPVTYVACRRRRRSCLHHLNWCLHFQTQDMKDHIQYKLCPHKTYVYIKLTISRNIFM